MQHLMATPAQQLSLVTVHFLFSFAQHTAKHNRQIISRDMNTQISKEENTKLALHNLPNV